MGYAVGTENTKAKILKNAQADLTLDAKENEIKNQISVFPNPTSDKINVTINSKFSQEFTISMSDMTGKSVYNQNFKNKNELIIDAKNFAKETYVLILKNQKQSYSQKIIIN